MKPRSKPLAAEGPRYEIVNLGEERGQHALRFPSPMLAARVMDLWWVEGEEQGIARRLRHYGLVIGVCWWHMDNALEAEMPPASAPAQTWADYSAAVVEELIDAGYTHQQLGSLFASMLPRLLAWMNEWNKVKEQADFFDQPREGA